MAVTARTIVWRMLRGTGWTDEQLREKANRLMRRKTITVKVMAKEFGITENAICRAVRELVALNRGSKA